MTSLVLPIVEFDYSCQPSLKNIPKNISLDKLRCVLQRFFLQRFMRVIMKTHLTNVDVNRQSTRISKRDFHQRNYPLTSRCSSTMKPFLANLRTHRHDQDLSRPASAAPESSRTSSFNKPEIHDQYIHLYTMEL